MKGWRTIIFNVLVVVATIAGALIWIDWYGLGLSARATILAVIVVNLASSGANIVLRSITNTPVGDNGDPLLDDDYQENEWPLHEDGIDTDPGPRP